jgi:ATP-dependent Clp protease ATP-binding subunit ClpA
VGFCDIFKHFSLDSPPGQTGFEFFLLSSRVHARPSASIPKERGRDANHWADKSISNVSSNSLKTMTQHVNKLLTDQSQLSAQRSYEIAREYRHDLIEVAHVFLALLDYPDEILMQVLNSLGISDIETLKSETRNVIKRQKKVPFWRGRKYKMFITPLVKQSIDDAIVLSKELKIDKASSAHIFWSVINTCAENGHDRYIISREMREVFGNHDITAEKVLKILKEINDRSNNEQNSEKDS